MEKATLKQAGKLIELFEEVPLEQLQELLGSGLLTDLRDANLAEIRRDEFRKLCGLESFAQAIPAVPANSEIFELTLDGDAIDPMEMVRADGYDPRNWQFQGPVVKGTQTRRFMLVQVGYCRNLDEVRQKVEAGSNTLAEGQWREAFREKYPKPTKGDLIGFGGSRWVNPFGDRSFPYLGDWGGAWRSDFGWSDDGLNGSWRWLVEVK